MKYLSDNPKMSDVIAWTMAAPAIVIGLVFCPYLIYTYPKFEKMFTALGAKLPDITVFMISNNHWFLSVVPNSISILLIFLLAKHVNQPICILWSFIAIVLNWFIWGLVLSGLFLPILELQKQLN